MRRMMWPVSFSCAFHFLPLFSRDVWGPNHLSMPKLWLPAKALLPHRRAARAASAHARAFAWRAMRNVFVWLLSMFNPIDHARVLALGFRNFGVLPALKHLPQGQTKWLQWTKNSVLSFWSVDWPRRCEKIPEVECWNHWANKDLACRYL